MGSRIHSVYLISNWKFYLKCIRWKSFLGNNENISHWDQFSYLALENAYFCYWAEQESLAGRERIVWGNPRVFIPNFTLRVKTPLFRRHALSWSERGLGNPIQSAGWWYLSVPKDV